MAEIPRLNGIIKALEEGKTAFVSFTSNDIETAAAMAGSKLDGVAFEMEHAPLDIPGLRHSLQYMLDAAAGGGSRHPGAGGDAHGAHPAQRQRDEPVAGQAGARHRRLRDHLPARQLGGGGAQRGIRLPLPAPFVRAALRSAGHPRRRAPPAPPATGGSRSRNTTSARTCGRWRRTARSWW